MNSPSVELMRICDTLTATGWNWNIGWCPANRGGYYAQAFRNKAKPEPLVSSSLAVRDVVTEGGTDLLDAVTKLFSRVSQGRFDTEPHRTPSHTSGRKENQRKGQDGYAPGKAGSPP